MRVEPANKSGAADRAGGLDVMKLLRDIAKPRLTGSDGAADVTATLMTTLENLDYEVRQQPFTFSPWLGRFGITAAGAVYLAAMFVAAGFLYTNHPDGAIALLLIALVLIGLGAMFASAAIDSLPFGRVDGSNLLAIPRGGRVRYIIMAHRDSKSQPVPLAFRGPAIVLAVVAWLALFIAALFHMARPLPGGLILLVGALGVVAGVVLVFCWVDNRSPGALDNASGVAAAVGIAARERAAGDVGVLITDAEELGLAGARAAVGTLPPVFGVINLDGLDDDGTFYVFERFGLINKRGLAPHLAAALLEEAAQRGEPADRRDLPVGIPVDHIPLVRAGIPALTVMRGSVRSLRRVHRSIDDLAHLRGDGVLRTMDLVAGALHRLRERARPLER